MPMGYSVGDLDMFTRSTWFLSWGALALMGLRGTVLK